MSEELKDTYFFFLKLEFDFEKFTTRISWGSEFSSDLRTWNDANFLQEWSARTPTKMEKRCWIRTTHDTGIFER